MFSTSARQLPSPAHPAARVSVPAVQLTERQRTSVRGYTQVARNVPSQAPPQPVPSSVQAARDPRGVPATAPQTPGLAASSQASHWPVQAALQQRPSAQFPLTHWPPGVQAAPSNRVPSHIDELLQNAAPTQSESPTQVVPHAVPTQR